MGTQMPSGEVDCGTDINFSWQHSVSVMDNGNIVFLDNGNLSNDFDSSLSSPLTRALEVDPNDTGDGCAAEVVWEHTLDPSLYGLASGNAQKLENGNYLISTVADGGTTLEVSPDHSLVWEAKYNLNLGLIHRAYRASGLYPVDVSAVASNYTSINGVDVIEVPSSDSVRVWFTLYNNGTESEQFIYKFENIVDENPIQWYEYQEGLIEIPAGEQRVIDFTGDYMTEPVAGIFNNIYNDVELTISSVNNYNVLKKYNFTVHGVESVLSNSEVVSTFSLMEVYPNPFNPTTGIRIKSSNLMPGCSLVAYDISGRVVQEIFSGPLEAGTHMFQWSPTEISSGKYFVKFITGDIVQVSEVVYLK